MYQLAEISIFLKGVETELDILRQNRLLDEGSLLIFMKERGIPLKDTVAFYAKGWLTRDDVTPDGETPLDHPLFHPFRMYPKWKAFIDSWLAIIQFSDQSQSVATQVPGFSKEKPLMEQSEEVAKVRNGITDLAILLEPLYWPRITERITSPGELSGDEFESLLADYRLKVKGLVRNLDPTRWQKLHELVCRDAASLDQNDRLYLLLRCAKWDEREKLTGTISGALWLRHIAEVIRRGFEEAHEVTWIEEDQVQQVWLPGDRRNVYGSDRPLDDETVARPYLAWSYGLLTGSVVHWYVEGQTEFYAVLRILPNAADLGIELLNLYGSIEAERGNTAVKLKDWLEEDKNLRRFSMVSFDRDVTANVKTFQRLVKEETIVGFITANDPDFEFANFTVDELVEIAARIDEADGFPADKLRSATWTDVKSGKAFEKRYEEHSSKNGRALKGKVWGEALADYAVENPNRADTGDERPLWIEIREALMGRITDYNFQKEHFTFDPVTFTLIPRS